MRAAFESDEKNFFRPFDGFVFLALSALGFLIYSNTFKAPFAFDDEFAIIENTAIRHGLDLPALWNAFNTRVVVGLSLALNCSIGRLDVTSYHIFNTAVHVLAAFTVHLLARSLFRTPAL